MMNSFFLEAFRINNISLCYVHIVLHQTRTFPSI